MTGRYRSSGTVDITLTGSIDGATQEYTYEEQSFPTRAVRESYLPRLWATRKIGFLLNSVRFDGPSDEVVEEIVELSKQFGIITPYTSFLVEEPDLTADEAQFRFRRSAVPELAPAAGAPSTGLEAFDTALEVGKLADGSAPYSVGNDQAAAVRNVGDHSFFLDDGVWTDASYDGGSTAKIGFASDDYFDILEKRPDWGAYFALGEQVIFVGEVRAYEITPGDFPPVDVPAQPQSQPPEDRSPSVPAPQPETSDGSSTPWTRFIVGGAVVAAALLGGGWSWRRRRAAER
jgi:Ca-activated chloride channel family protein